MANYVFPLPGWQGQIQLHHGSHKGASDLMANSGWPVVSMTSGSVESAGDSPVGGNNVMIMGDDNLEYYYAHLKEKPLVKSGDRVQPGTRIGSVGNTGNAESTPPHLHIGIGPSISSGVGPAGGAGTGDFDAVAMLQAIYSGQPPLVGQAGNTNGDGWNPFDGITDATTAGFVKILTAFFSTFTKILRGG